MIQGELGYLIRSKRPADWKMFFHKKFNQPKMWYEIQFTKRMSDFHPSFLHIAVL